jgi:hypothetical protein
MEEREKPMDKVVGWVCFGGGWWWLEGFGGVGGGPDGWSGGVGGGPLVRNPLNGVPGSRSNWPDETKRNGPPP